MAIEADAAEVEVEGGMNDDDDRAAAAGGVLNASHTYVMRYTDTLTPAKQLW